MSIHSIPYFQHDNDMRNDPRIKALRTRYGLEGYAVYCFTLEYLTYNQCEDIALSDLNLELLSGDFGINASKLKEMYLYMISIKLFESNGEYLGSQKLKSRLEKLFIKREKWRLAKQQKSEKNAISDEKNNFSDNKIKNSLENERKSIVEEEKSIVEEEYSKEKHLNHTELTDTVSKSPEEAEKNSPKFIIPTTEEIREYCREKKYPDYSNKFIEYYNKHDWKVGKGKKKSKMENWRLAVGNWHNNTAIIILGNTFGKESELAKVSAAKKFVKSLLETVGEEQTIMHLENLQKLGFKKLATMEEQTEVSEEVQTDGTVKKILRIKPKATNGTYRQQFKSSYEARGTYEFDPIKAEARRREIEQLFGENAN